MGELVQHAFDRREFKYPLESSRWTRVVQAAGRYLPVERFDAVHDLSDIRTTYLDTANLASYREYVEDRPLRKKVRIRQYGYERRFANRLWVEIKIKRRSMSFKRRFCSDLDELSEFMAGRDVREAIRRRNHGVSEALDVYQAARTMIAKRRLSPVIRVDFERMSFQDPDSPDTRITVDRHLRFRTAHGPSAAAYDGIILEVKCANGNPAWLADFRRAAGIDEDNGFSKYARAVMSLSMDAGRRRNSA